MSYPFNSLLGGGVQGLQPKLLGGGAGSTGGTGMEGGNERGMDRQLLRSAFGNRALFPGDITSVPLIDANSGLTPFRKAMNAGDIAMTYNSNPSSRLPGSNQLNNQWVTRIHANRDGINNNGGALYSGNPKYVYDGSDYARYKKLRAINKNYNDLSFGGANNGAFVAYKRVRH